VILVVTLAIVVAGFFVPVERSFTNEIDINAPADNVWNTKMKQRVQELNR